MAAVWLVEGNQSLKEYCRDRQAAANRFPEVRGTDCFHDGQKMLDTVAIWHERLKKRLRRDDVITEPVLQLIECMLHDEKSRAKATFFWRWSRRILEKAKGNLKEGNVGSDLNTPTKPRPPFNPGGPSVVYVDCCEFGEHTVADIFSTSMAASVLGRMGRGTGSIQPPGTVRGWRKRKKPWLRWELRRGRIKRRKKKFRKFASWRKKNKSHRFVGLLNCDRRNQDSTSVLQPFASLTSKNVPGGVVLYTDVVTASLVCLTVHA